MKMIRDEKNQVYVWVSDDETQVLSPRFDYEEDADEWFKNMVELVKTQILKHRL
jgi:hypothetical protein